MDNSLIMLGGKMYPRLLLKQALPDVELVFFFAKLKKLDASDLASLLWTVHRTTVSEALFASSEQFSHELQDYLVELGYEGQIEKGDIRLKKADEPDPVGEILPQFWDQLEVTVASSIQEMADKFGKLLVGMDGKTAEMMFRSLLKFNATRPTLGSFEPHFQRLKQAKVLIVFDTSGSVGENVVSTIAEEVVALGYRANATLALVSNITVYWDPGMYTVDSVLEAAQYAGTHYETLDELLGEDWDIVITIADYDSSADSKRVIGKCTGRIGQVLDVSLVNRPTYLSEVVGQLADEVRPVLVAKEYIV